MFAIVRTGGKQLRVDEGARLRVESLPGEVGESITLEDVLLVQTPEATVVGRPRVEGAAVHATIVRQGKARKVRVYKYKRRKGYRRTKGHRQQYTELHIDRIDPGAQA